MNDWNKQKYFGAYNYTLYFSLNFQKHDDYMLRQGKCRNLWNTCHRQVQSFHYKPFKQGKANKKTYFTKKKRVYGNCVVLFLNAQLDINSLQRQPQKVTQETVEITHHLSLALNERCFSRQLPGITRVMQAWSSSKVYLCRWVIRGNKKLMIVIPNSHGWCRNH